VETNKVMINAHMLKLKTGSNTCRSDPLTRDPVPSVDQILEIIFVLTKNGGGVGAAAYVIAKLCQLPPPYFLPQSLTNTKIVFVRLWGKTWGAAGPTPP